MTVEVKTLEELRKLNLFELIKTVFDNALAKGDLVYQDAVDSQIVRDPLSKIDNEVKIVDGLSKRPNNRASEPGSKEKTISESRMEDMKKNNPFTNPEPELTIIDSLLGQYRVILNKYPNSKYHFLLVTKEFEKQDSLLDPMELQIIHTILDNLNKGEGKNEGGSRYFSFFNSGPESGYSQFHKHIQFMMMPEEIRPYQEDVVRNVNYFIPKEIVENRRPLFYKNASFKHYILKLKEYDSFETEEEEEDERDSLATLYMYLIKRSMNIFREYEDHVKLSYNFIMMADWMMIVPRRNAKFEDIWQNALGFMGMFFVKNEEMKEKVLKLGFSKILEECAFPLEEDEEHIVYNEYGY
jgi:sulfate adenylyltransferase (ADP) / ATP adenylyltransferase